MGSTLRRGRAEHRVSMICFLLALKARLRRLALQPAGRSQGGGCLQCITVTSVPPTHLRWPYSPCTLLKAQREKDVSASDRKLRGKHFSENSSDGKEVALRKSACSIQLIMTAFIFNFFGCTFFFFLFCPEAQSWSSVSATVLSLNFVAHP